ncbi:hypothetical protein L0Y40_00085 [Candidatus Wolfebacteria bacterium]|nr:hypothetical protein [Candidatus Wolfebacteria bacterium]
MPDTSTNYRVPNTTWALMFCVAGLYDLASFIPIVNVVIVPVAWLHFWMWFKLHGVSIGFTNPKRLVTTGTTSLIEFIPAISAIPTWIAFVGAQLLFTKLEEKTGIALPKPGGSGKAPLRGGKSAVRKTARRITQSTEHNREARGRLANIRDIRSRKQPTGTIDGIIPQPNES